MYIHVQILKLVNFVLEFSLFVITILKYKMHWVRRWNYVSDLFLLMLYQFEGIAGLYIPPPSSFKKPSIPSFKFFSSLFFAGNQIFSWGGGLPDEMKIRNIYPCCELYEDWGPTNLFSFALLVLIADLFSSKHDVSTQQKIYFTYITKFLGALFSLKKFIWNCTICHKKSWTILCSKLLYKFGQDFLDRKYVKHFFCRKVLLFYNCTGKKIPIQEKKLH